MSSDWTAEVVGRMHTAGITGLMLAQESGYEWKIWKIRRKTRRFEHQISTK